MTEAGKGGQAVGANGVPDPGGLLDRRLLLASAGSGKTYQLSSRLIGLLAVGAAPEEILASTFTRKAAGEILERVLVRLAEAALDPEAARKLAESMPAGVPHEALDSGRCGRILVRTLGNLHRLQIHTLDAFFHRVGRAFALELGLPAEWGVADEPELERLRSRALEAALANGDRAARIELVRAAGRGDADRSVHGCLTECVEALYELFREAQGGDEVWGGGPVAEPPPGPGREEWLDRFRALKVPLTARGTPHQGWAKAHDDIAAAVEGSDWEAFLEVGLVCRILEGKDRWHRVEIAADLRECILGLVALAAHSLRGKLRARVRALGRFLPHYHAELSGLQARRGSFGFRDLTWALAGMGRLESPDAVHYRLDGRIRHVLLDEFQDTSTGQWAALEPLVGEILSGYEGERAAFVVADPKQSIYGWRDGEPRLLEAIQARYGMSRGTMATSWRSSPVVLELVNRIFTDVHDNPVIAQEPVVQEVARRWGGSFEEHRAAREDLPGYVRLETASDSAGSGDAVLDRAAERIWEIHHRVPGATIGILTRRNRSVAELIARLREMGIEASEEGGVPIADCAPVVAMLAALRIADHPHDRVSRYLVARSPLGAALGFGDPDAPAAAAELSRSVREELLRDGYGSVLSRWARTLDPHAGERDRDRMRKLVELAFRWDRGAGLRPIDFVRAAEAARAEGAGESPVRIMTVHRAKGLEFDVVVLPELDRSTFTRGGLPSFLAERSDRGAGPVLRVHPGVKASWEPLFPELAEAASQCRESGIRDGLSALYVALTRARFATWMIVAPDSKGNSKARSDARLIREAFRTEKGPLEAPPDSVLVELGDPKWWQAGAAPERLRRPRRAPAESSRRATLELASSPRARLLPRRSPSELEGGDRVSLVDALRPRLRGALDRGTLVHAWLQEIEWLDGEDPTDFERETVRFLATAARIAPGLDDPAALLADLRSWLRAPEVRTLLTRASFPAGTVVERELPFVARDGGGILQGVADRVLRIPDPGAERLLIVDWKTDRIAPDDAAALAARAEHYRPQIQAYCRALARLEGVPEERVEGRLAFLRAGRVV